MFGILAAVDGTGRDSRACWTSCQPHAGLGQRQGACFICGQESFVIVHCAGNFRPLTVSKVLVILVSLLFSPGRGGGFANPLAPLSGADDQ